MLQPGRAGPSAPGGRALNPLVCQPIGFLRSCYSSKYQAPSQPEGGEQGVVELRQDDPRLLLALQDLDGFSRIWLIWWFHKNQSWRARVLPPRGRGGRKGLFATRSPHRPCPLGLSAVPLLGIEGHRLYLGEHDLLEGTPILDIKPYIPRFDAFPDESSGWFGSLDLTPRYQVLACPELDPELFERARAILEVDPMPHRTRRILALKDGRYRLSCGDHRLYYRIEGETVRIQEARLR